MLKPTISASVGKGGVNRNQDVKTIQNLINQNIKSIVPLRPLKEDGRMGPKTISAIEAFQRRELGLRMPDGRVDPGGKTITKLVQVVKPGVASVLSALQPLRFPLRARPAHSYKTGGRNFGASRSKGRLHAGCDLLANVGAEILAIKDGVVIQDAYPFYLGTYALEINHGDFVIRYGEISRVAANISKNVAVKRGQVIAYVGELKFKSGKKMSMLHLEMYSGKVQGRLTTSNKPYKRRSDLLDPTTYLDKAVIS